MIFIRRFLDKMSVADSKRSKDIVIPMEEARGLRDDITLLLSDLHKQKKDAPEEVVKLEIKGGSFK